MKKILIAIYLLLTISIAVAQESTSSSLEKPNIKSSGGFGAQLWLTDDPDFYKNWNKPTAGYKFSTVNNAIRGKPIFLIIYFAGPGTNEKNLCDVIVSIVVKTPDGKIYGELPNGNCWQNLPAPPKGNIQISNASMGIVIEEKDSSGRYTVEATVKDKVKNVELHLKQYFDVK